MERNGRALSAGWLSRDYGFTAIDGRQQPGYYPKEGVFDHFSRSFQLLVPDLLPGERVSHLELIEMANQMKILEPRNIARTDLIEAIEGIDSARFAE